MGYVLEFVGLLSKTIGAGILAALMYVLLYVVRLI